MDPVKESFRKVKEDIDSLREQLFVLTEEVLELKESLIHLLNHELYNSEEPNRQTNQQTDTPVNQTYSLEKQTLPTHNPPEIKPFKPLEAQNLGISTGNEGVPTDRQTNQQTNQQTHYTPVNRISTSNLTSENNTPETYQKKLTPMDNALEILNSLDSVRKEIRLKFKDLTDQEFLVFSTLYQLEEESGFTNYKTLSERLNLSESSVRDYIGKLIKKEIPVEKIKIHNKNIQLSISPALKKVASLNAILQLRDL